MLSLKVKLEDGRTVEIFPLSSKTSTKELLRYINALIREGTYLRFYKTFTLKQEEEWKKSTLNSMKNGNVLWIGAVYKGKIVAGTQGTRGLGKERDNIEVGIAVAKVFRGVGLGEIMLKEVIKRVKKKMKPKNIFLHVAKPNKPAQSLYKKLGFKEIATFPKWFRHKGKYVDIHWMVLKNA